MAKLGDYFKSRNHTEILRVLSLSEVPLGIRAMAICAGAHPYACSRIIREWVGVGLLEKHGSQCRRTYRLRDDHPEASRLRKLFEADREECIRRDREDLSRRAQVLMDFNRQAHRALRLAKDSLHEAV